MREGLSRPLWLAVVVVAFCIPLFVGLGRTDMENDEAIYSYAVDGILRTGDWLNPLSSPHDDAIFLEKPPLKFWIVAAPIKLGLLPHDEFGLRVWDALFGAISFLYVFALGRRLAGPLCGVIAVMSLFVYWPLLFEHGLRNNNMEAPLVLCYCGGVYHYVAWASAASNGDEGKRRRHVLAIFLYFFLGFMTKFVAALFLPIVLGVLTIIDRGARTRLVSDWRRWALGVVLFFAFASPWFIYQQIVAGSHLWSVILGTHVVMRMTVSIDPSHIHPWDYYFKKIFQELEYAGIAWLALIGAVLLIVTAAREGREKRLPAIAILTWFIVPMGLISMGTSKLHHYAYPFLPPVALAAGFGPAWLIEWSRPYMDRLMSALDVRLDAWRGRGTAVRTVLLTLAGIAIVIAIATLIVGQLQLHIGDTVVFRNSRVSRPLLLALLLATVAGRGVLAARLLVPLMLLVAVLPTARYEETLRLTERGDHSMRSARDCLMQVRARELAAGRRPPSIFAIGEQKWMLHSHYYYFHHLGKWERSELLDERVVERGLFSPGEERPILIGDADYQTLKGTHGAALLAVPALRMREVLLLMPGPYAICDPVKQSADKSSP